MCDDRGLPSKKFLTPDELAERWGISRGHLANQRVHGVGLGYCKIGQRVLYRISDVEAYEDAHYVKGTES